MASGPLLRRSGALLLPPRLFPESGYYALMAQYPAAAIDTSMRFNKRDKAVHRYRIADTRGLLELTVPVAKPDNSGTCWNETGVSAHGRWWEIHRTALESAYGRTPFFEFYIDRLADILAPRPLEKPESIGDLCLRADAAVRSILGLDTAILPADDAIDRGADDVRRTLPIIPAVPYWQIRAGQLGFIAGLSVLDLIFNTGPEAPAVLLAMIEKSR